MPERNRTITLVLGVIIIIAALTVIYISLPKNTSTNETNDQEQQNGNDNETEDETVLTVIYMDEQDEYTMAQFEDLDSITGMGGYRTSYPVIKGTGNYTGVSITYLVDLIAGDIENYSIIVHSDDGETKENKTYNYSQILGEVDIYDSTNASNGIPIDQGNVTMILAYMLDGQYFDESEDGIFKTAFIKEDEQLITSSGLWWKYVYAIEVIIPIT